MVDGGVMWNLLISEVNVVSYVDLLVCDVGFIIIGYIVFMGSIIYEC